MDKTKFSLESHSKMIIDLRSKEEKHNIGKIVSKITLLEEMNIWKEPPTVISREVV